MFSSWVHQKYVVVFFSAQVIKRYVFVNVTTGVSDRSVFTVPATCNSAVIGPKVLFSCLIDLKCG